MKNYTKTLKDIEVIEALNFSSSNYERSTKGNTSDKTCKIALIYNEAAKRMSKESREEIYKNHIYLMKRK